MHCDDAERRSPLHYATYFDRHYLTRGLALHASLVRHSPPFCLWILCLDAETERTLARLRLEGVSLVSLAELERHDPALLAVRAGRLPIEYYFSCTASWLVYLLDRQPEVETITYLDADLYFFGDPTPIYEELGSSSILLIPYRRPKAMAHFDARNGLYVVSMQAFRRTAEGLACLRRWREQSLEWCFDRRENGRFGEQGYIQEWPSRYHGVTTVRHKGAGVAHFNVLNYRVARRGGQVFVDDQPLIFGHMSRFRIVTPWLYDTGLGLHGAPVHRAAKRLIYLPYARELRRVAALVRAAGSQVPPLDNVRFGPQPRSELLHAIRRGRTLIVTDAFALC